MDLTWYSRSDVMTDVVAELAPCIVMFEIGLAGTVYGVARSGQTFPALGRGFGVFPGFLNHDPLFGF